MSEVRQYYIGWDVGAWNCDTNSKSKDAIVILDANSALVGTPWRGNLRELINISKTTEDFILNLFSLCKTDVEIKSTYTTIAIDAPLGFSKDLVELINGNIYADDIANHCNNPYLFRATEQLLFKKGLKPLSTIKDMIGSQTTKAMHVVRKFTNKIESCGVFINKNK